MKAILVSGLLFLVTLVVLVAGQLIFGTDNEANASTKPWIEVISAKAFLMDPQSDKPFRELATGDELAAGARVKTDESGLAEIHFADGSVLRVDADTEFVLDDGQYNSKTNSLVVRINLLFGRVWSKVVGLATPDSVWEVKTSNAVATVRGTAFGMEFIDGISNVIGSENQVAVSPIDPETKVAISEAEVLVGPEKLVEIRPEKIQRIKNQLALAKASAKGGQKDTAAAVSSAVVSSAKDVLLAVEKAPAKILEQAWVNRAKEADKELEASVKELENTGIDQREIYKEAVKTLRKNIKEKKIRPAIKELQDEIRKEITNKLKEAKVNSPAGGEKFPPKQDRPSAEKSDIRKAGAIKEFINKVKKDQETAKKVEIPIEDRRLDQNMTEVEVIPIIKAEPVEVKPILRTE